MEQKLRNDLWHDSELIAAKICSQISCKWNVMFESYVELHWLDKPQAFYSLKIIIYCVSNHPLNLEDLI